MYYGLPFKREMPKANFSLPNSKHRREVSGFYARVLTLIVDRFQKGPSFVRTIVV